MLRLGPSDPGLAQPTLMEDGKNTATNFSFSRKLGYGLYEAGRIRPRFTN